MKRGLRAILTLIAIVTSVFLAMRVIPGDPALVQLGDYATPELVKSVEAELGLDRPLHAQYVGFVSELTRGDLGYSFRSRQPVAQLVLHSVWYTLVLAVVSFVFASILGVVGGVAAAAFRGRLPDRIIGGVSAIGLSAPSFWVALILVLLFSLKLGWTPVAGGGSFMNPLGFAHHLVLPAIAISLREAAILARVVRNAMIETMGQEFVLVAVAKGIGRRAVLTRHVLRNALLPVVSMASVRFITLLSGIFVVEVVFARPGLGTLLVEAIRSRDFPVVQGVILVIGVFVIAISLLGDVAYSIADPRVRNAA